MVGIYMKNFRLILIIYVFSLTFCVLAVSSQRPSYPSSKPTKNWDKLEAEVTKEVYEFISLIGGVCVLFSSTLLC